MAKRATVQFNKLLFLFWSHEEQVNESHWHVKRFNFVCFLLIFFLFIQNSTWMICIHFKLPQIQQQCLPTYDSIAILAKKIARKNIILSYRKWSIRYDTGKNVNKKPKTICFHIHFCFECIFVEVHIINMTISKRWGYCSPMCLPHNCLYKQDFYRNRLKSIFNNNNNSKKAKNEEKKTLKCSIIILLCMRIMLDILLHIMILFSFFYFFFFSF